MPTKEKREIRRKALREFNEATNQKREIELKLLVVNANEANHIDMAQYMLAISRQRFAEQQLEKIFAG